MPLLEVTLKGVLVAVFQRVSTHSPSDASAYDAPDVPGELPSFSILTAKASTSFLTVNKYSGVAVPIPSLPSA